MKKVVLLDFDKTLTTRDTTRYFFLCLLRLRPWKSFIFSFYLFKMLFSSQNIKFHTYKNKAIGLLISGLTDEDISKALNSFSKKVEELLRPLLIKKISEWSKNDILILIVTASPNFAVKRSLSKLPVYIVGTHFKKINGLYTGDIRDLYCYGENKVKCIENWIRKKEISANYIEAWSDHLSDLPMLKIAKKRYWIGEQELLNKIRLYDPGGNFIYSGK